MIDDYDKKVIIIGNSPSVLENKYGAIVDSYDTVIRLNNCPTVGFEQFIGKKINIWATTKNILHQDNFYPAEYDNLDYVWHRTNSTKRKCKLPHDNIPSLVMYKNRFFNNNFKKYEEIFHKTTNHELCTGMLAILTSTVFFRNIDILGFKFYQNVKDNNYAYYRKSQADKNNKHYEDVFWKEGKASGFVGREIAKVKKEIIDDLVNKRKINILD
tara:strand:+ start:662 stop:1303 length:642 start_codon:yes stop_codon:yes gene_type:complete